MPSWTAGRACVRAASGSILLTLALALSGNADGVLAAGPPPAPHSSCDSEATRASTEGEVQATLTVINLTNAPFKLYWLDYDGQRVFYQDSPPSSTLEQPTWLTHPWVLADANGTCYLLVVVNAVRQTMTIGTTTAGESLTPVPASSVPPPTARPATPGARTPRPAAATPRPTASPAADSAGAGPGFPTPLVVGALAMMGILVGVLHATGRFNGFRRR